MSRLIEVHHQGRVERFQEEDLPLVIGAGADAHIRLADLGSQAVYLALSQGHLFIQPAQTMVLFLHNDLQVSTSMWVKSGDTTRIGSNIIHYRISGDRIGIEIQELQGDHLEPPVLTPPEGVAEDMPTKRSKLPRQPSPVHGPTQRQGGRYLAGALFLLLLLTTVFMLAARSVDINISPQPEHFSVHGFPPGVRFDHRFLGLPGRYLVLAEKKGYQSLSQEIVIDASSPDTYSFTLEKKPGRVTITTLPVTAAEVLVDGKPFGLTPLEDLSLAAGVHHLLVRKDRYKELMARVEVIGMEQQQNLIYTLQPAWGEITIITEPAGALVQVSSTSLGVTPLTLELAEGEHVLQLSKEAYSPFQVDVEVRAGERRSLEPIALVPAPAQVEITSSPVGATVVVDGDYRGVTPLVLMLSPTQQHLFSLKLPGYAVANREVAFSPGEAAAVVVKMQAEYGVVFFSAAPPGGQLYIDGKEYGGISRRLKLPADKKIRLRLEKEGYEPGEKTIIPRKGYSQQVEIRLVAKGEVQQAAPSGVGLTKGYKKLFSGSVVMQMGASRREPGRRANEQERQVALSRPVLMGVREVTNGEFRRFDSRHRSGMVGGYTLDGDAQPVVRVSWEAAARYCNWLSVREGLPPFYQEQGQTLVPVQPFTVGYRLPTEAEWAYGARLAGRQSRARYSWEGTFPPRVKSGNYGDESAAALLPVIIRGYNDGFPVSAPTGRFGANNGGFFDMGGNVAEWAHDYYSAYTVIGAGKQVEDPSGPASGAHHVVRGSGWRDAAITELRLSFRGYSRKAQDDIGFRVARYLQ